MSRDSRSARTVVSFQPSPEYEPTVEPRSPIPGLRYVGTDISDSTSSEENHREEERGRRRSGGWSDDYGGIASVATGSRLVRRVRSPWRDPGDDQYGDAVGCWESQVGLSLDGGGVRGLAELLILERLMDIIARREYEIDQTSSSHEPHIEEPFKVDGNTRSKEGKAEVRPCHYFDYICGTSLGGIIAILLGRLRLSVTEAIICYKESWNTMANLVTDVDRMLPGSAARKQRSLGLQNALKKTIQLQKKQREHRYLMPVTDDAESYLSDPDLCKTVVLAVQYDDARSTQWPYLFRSYEFTATEKTTLNRNVHDTLDKVTITDACRATSAAPVYFKSAKIGGRRYRDGSLWMSNPAMELYREMKTMNSDADRPIHCLVSIGSGKEKRDFANTARRLFSPGGMPRRTSVYDHEQRKVDEVLESRHNGGERFSYFRFDGPDDLRVSRLSDWKSPSSRAKIIKDIESSTAIYCDSVKKQLEKLADILVDYRRQRAQTTHWENYVYVDIPRKQAQHKCPPCQRQFDQDSFISHLRSDHPEYKYDQYHGLLRNTKVEIQATQ